MVYAERYVGFYLSFLIPIIAFLTCFPVLFFRKKHYTLRKPEKVFLVLPSSCSAGVEGSLLPESGCNLETLQQWDILAKRQGNL
jgi:hypothetical protein